METIELPELVKPGNAGFLLPDLHVTLLATGDGIGLWQVRCSCGQAGYESRDLTPEPLLVIVRRGAFRRRTSHGETLADPGFAYFANPGSDEEYAHPEDGGDMCVSMTMAPELVAAVTGGNADLPTKGVPVDAPAYRSLRRLVLEASARSRDDWVERAVCLFGDIYGVARSRGSTAVRPRTRTGHAKLADLAREALVAKPTMGVPELGRIVGCSPYHLSRVFRRETGATLSAYRLRLRVRGALERIAAGDENLARVAADFGFADHSHLTRMVVREVGETPRAVREAGHG